MSALTPPRAHIRRGRCVAVFHVREQGSPACSALPNGSRYIHMDTATLTGSKIPDQFRGLFTVGLTTLMSMLGDGIVTQPGGDYSLAALAPPQAARQLRRCPRHLRPAQARRSRHTTDRCQWSHQTGRNIICFGQSHYDHDSLAIHPYHRRAVRQRGQGQHGHRLID